MLVSSSELVISLHCKGGLLTECSGWTRLGPGLVESWTILGARVLIELPSLVAAGTIKFCPALAPSSGEFGYLDIIAMPLVFGGGCC